MVCSLKTYDTYYNNRAQLWEVQALTRARPIMGPSQNDFIEIAKRAWQTCGQNSDLYVSIDSMLERIRRERGSGSDFFDLKTGIGGIIEAEFLIQAMQIREGIWEPNWSLAVDALGKQGQLTQEETAQLKHAYQFLRHCESVLRRHENRSVSTLPVDLTEQFRFCRRLGFENTGKFPAEYEAARSSIHEIYNRRIKGLAASAG